jgi:hypothetical protein
MRKLDVDFATPTSSLRIDARSRNFAGRPQGGSHYDRIAFNPHRIQRALSRIATRLHGSRALLTFSGFTSPPTVYTTDAEEEEPNLEPWIQWPTVHSGMPFREHGIFHLGDGRKLDQKCIAEVLSDAGVPVGVCGSMNLNYGMLNGYVRLIHGQERQRTGVLAAVFTRRLPDDARILAAKDSA